MWKLSVIIAVFSLIEYVKCGEKNFQNVVYIKWQNLGNQTQFWLTADLPASTISDVTNAWISVGINDIHGMVIITDIFFNYTINLH